VTVLDAVRAARAIESEPGAYTRRALIYAIAKDGHATLLTAALIEKLRNWIKATTEARTHKGHLSGGPIREPAFEFVQ
jgi:hypothetical protein